MRVCVVGSGGREHALAVALARSATVVVTPGNAGITALAGDLPITCSAEEPADVEADLWVIGPEQPLVSGLADRLRSGGRAVFGPGADGARLEGSKGWMKELLAAAGVPTAKHATFVSAEAAVTYLRAMSPPYVVKTDGLAAGKGVLVTDSLTDAIADVGDKLLGQKFGEAGRAVVIEEGLVGRELSVMAICDGTRAVPLAAAQDFKRALDGDEGLNTGGMGAYSPVGWASASVVGEVMATAVRPTLAALSEQGIDYRGVLYAGVMLTDEGPKILEFNVRFGDPETQVVLPRWQGDVAEVLLAAAEGRLDTVEPPSFDDDLAAVCVVLASDGYPARPRTGDPVTGLAAAAAHPGVSVFAAGLAAVPAPAADGSAGLAPAPASDRPAGTGFDADGPNGDLVTAGGRVAGITALAPTLADARASAYGAVADVSARGLWCRGDIAATVAVPPDFPQPPDYEEARP